MDNQWWDKRYCPVSRQRAGTGKNACRRDERSWNRRCKSGRQRICIWTHPCNSWMRRQAVAWSGCAYGHCGRCIRGKYKATNHWELWREGRCPERFRRYSESRWVPVPCRIKGQNSDHNWRNHTSWGRWQGGNRRDSYRGRRDHQRRTSAWKDLHRIYTGWRDCKRSKAFWCGRFWCWLCLHFGRWWGRRDSIRELQCIDCIYHHSRCQRTYGISKRRDG